MGCFHGDRVNRFIVLCVSAVKRISTTRLAILTRTRLTSGNTVAVAEEEVVVEGGHARAEEVGDEVAGITGVLEGATATTIMPSMGNVLVAVSLDQSLTHRPLSRSSSNSFKPDNRDVPAPEKWPDVDDEFG